MHITICDRCRQIAHEGTKLIPYCGGYKKVMLCFVCQVEFEHLLDNFLICFPDEEEIQPTVARLVRKKA